MLLYVSFTLPGSCDQAVKAFYNARKDTFNTAQNF